MAAGSLTIVGLGPGRAEWVTLEAAEVLRAAARNPLARAYGFPPVHGVAAAVAPDLEVRDPALLAQATGPQPAPRPGSPYAPLVQGMLRQAFADGLDVLYLAPGNALVVNDLVLLVRRTCARYSKPVRLVAGLSFLDTVLERTFWHAERGLQLYSAWEVAAGRRQLDPEAPVLLFELGESVPPGGGPDAQTESMLQALHTVLAAEYPADHPLLLLYSTGPPDHHARSHALPRDGLPALAVPPLSNLWIPAARGGTTFDREQAP